jgi:hypothetical protein
MAHSWAAERRPRRCGLRVGGSSSPRRRRRPAPQAPGTVRGTPQLRRPSMNRQGCSPTETSRAGEEGPPGRPNAVAGEFSGGCPGKMLPDGPFEALDREGVVQLVEMPPSAAARRRRNSRSGTAAGTAVNRAVSTPGTWWRWTTSPARPSASRSSIPSALHLVHRGRRRQWGRRRLGASYSPEERGLKPGGVVGVDAVAAIPDCQHEPVGAPHGDPRIAGQVAAFKDAAVEERPGFPTRG